MTSEKKFDGVLDAYRAKNLDNVMTLTEILGTGTLVMGMIVDNTATVAAGAAIMFSSAAEIAGTYAKAYMEARLDYLANGRFTKLD